MRTRIASVLFTLVLSAVFYSASAQTISPGKQTLDKKEYLGLTLNQNIPDKNLSSYWESYLERFGKVKGKRGSYTIAKASLPAISANPVQVTSEVSSVDKKQSKVFLALYAEGNYVTNYNDDSYKAAENILKDFSDYAATREEVRLADEIFTTAEKGHQKLQRDLEDKAKEIEKTEKKLTELRSEVEKGKVESQNSLMDLQNKQKALETAKLKVK
jgi:hypothetical protein